MILYDGVVVKERFSILVIGSDLVAIERLVIRDIRVDSDYGLTVLERLYLWLLCTS